MATVDVVAREVVVHGRVQGVFFRASCQQEAQRLGVRGWVANEPDGAVRAWFEGSPGGVEAMCEWCLYGPSTASVDRVDAVAHEAGGLQGFEVR